MSDMCRARTFSVSGGDVQCDQPPGHERSHTVHRGGRLVMSWVGHAEFQAAKARGDFDLGDCTCDRPVPVCVECGGELR